MTHIRASAQVKYKILQLLILQLLVGFKPGLCRPYTTSSLEILLDNSVLVSHIT